MGSVLEVEKLSKSFGSLKALDEVSIDVEEKTVTMLIGPNGSGKTTLVNVVTGLYSPDSGKVVCFGKDVTREKPHDLYNLGVARTFQIPNLFWKLTVLENLLVSQKGNPGEGFINSLVRRRWEGFEEETIARGMRILGLIGLTKSWDTLASTLSGGQMKLLEIGRALMSDSKLLLLDEPISGVNPTLAHDIFSKILKLRDDLGITFFIIEHRLDIALGYVDSVVAMAYGKKIAEGVPKVVMTDVNVIDAYLGG